MTAIDTVNRVFREFKRYTGDGLPSEPTGAPLPVGDPSSGPHSPKKSEIRAAMGEALTGAEEDADRAEAAAGAAEDALSSIVATSFASRTAAMAYAPVVAPLFIVTLGYAAAGDMGGAEYKKVASEPAHAGKFSITLDDAVTVVWYELSSQTVYGEMFGLKFDNATESATANSTAFQAAIDYLEDLGGGVLNFVGGGDAYAYLNAVPIVRGRVSLRGGTSLEGRGACFRKFGSTASTETSAHVPRWGGGAIGYPVAVIQLGHIGGTNWSGTCEFISVFGDTDDLDTTTTEYGFFISGMSDGHMHGCTAEYVENGFFWSNGNTILSTVSQCVTNYTLRGFYQEFATSTFMQGNFAARAKYLGYDWCGHYSLFSTNATDHMGEGASNTEIALAYNISGCFGGHVQGNGAEFGKGSVMKISGCRDLTVTGNVTLVHGSDYVGLSDVIGIELGSNNINVKVIDNQFELDTPTGTAGRHFNWKMSDVQYGDYEFDNHFYNDWTSSGADTGWTNTSGILRTARGSFVGTLTGVSGTVTGTFEWRCEGNIVFLDIPAIEGTSNSTAATITGVPVAICPEAGKTRYAKVDAKDNGGNYNGRALVQDNGIITLQVGMSSTGFTASGTKGLFAGSIVYGR